MENEKLQQQLDDMNAKLALITEEIQEQRKFRMQVQGLQQDVSKVATDAVMTVTQELDEMSDAFNTEHVVYLLRKMALNTQNLSKSVDQLQSLHDLIGESTPIVKDVFHEAVIKLDEFANKGYFDRLQELQHLLEKVADNVSPADIKNISKNSEALATTLKNVSSKELLEPLNIAVDTYKTFTPPENKKVSLFKLLRHLISPDMRRLLVMAIEFTRKFMDNFSKQSTAKIKDS